MHPSQIMPVLNLAPNSNARSHQYATLIIALLSENSCARAGSCAKVQPVAGTDADDAVLLARDDRFSVRYLLRTND